MGLMKEMMKEIGNKSREFYEFVLPPIDMGNDESNRIRMTLRRAGIMVDEKLQAQLPSWTEMTSLYGSQPNIIGLERCEEFRHSLAKPSDALIGPAGMFNTGTNFLEQMLHLNCQIPDSTISTNGMRRNVPWGKHTPASWRLHFDAQVDGGVSHTDTLPIVMVKDLDPLNVVKIMANNKPLIAATITYALKGITS